MPLPHPLLMLVTDRHRCGRRPLMESVSLAVACGIDALQLREKDLEACELYELALECRKLTAGRCLLIVNGRVDIALAVGADGVHLPENGLPISAARAIAPGGFIVGRAVHDIATALTAERSDADYVQIGTIFATESKPGVNPAGLALVREAARSLTIPSIAVGGVDESNAASLISAGAFGVAVVSAILQAEDIPARVAHLRQALAQGIPAVERRGM
jgi:thiamine-phosphate pyrophosphorylase